MIRIAVISDTHGSLHHVAQAQEALGQVNWLLHAGDHLQDVDQVAELLGVPYERTRAVAGNCDYPAREPAGDVVDVEGVRIFLTHGHHFGVKQTLDRLYYRAAELDARVAVFGHTHLAHLDDDGDILLLNPGSLSKPRLAQPSCALLEVANGHVSGRIIYLHE